MAQQTITKVDPYYDWQGREGIRAISGLHIPDLNVVPLDPWARTGGRGAFINLGTKRGYKRAAFLVEIEPGGALREQRHCYEEVIYVVSGRGATTVWQEGKSKQLIEWSEGSLLSIPLNAWFQHFNGSNEPCRLLGYNNAPEVFSLFHNEQFVFDNPFTFGDRFAGDDGYFDGEGTLYSVEKRSYQVLETNFVPDAASIKLYEWAERGAGGLNVMFEMGDGVVPTHISQFPTGTYKKAHRHGDDAGGGALLLILAGTGFSVVWPPGEREFQKLDWQKNSLFVAPSSWFHQHFNTGPTPARYLALRGGGSQKYQTGGGQWVVDQSVKEGGSQIEYPDEDERIHQMFEAELAENGGTCRMGKLSPFCTAG